MKKSMSKALTLILAGIIAFTGMITLGTADTYAASKKPAKPTKVAAQALDDSAVRVSWKKGSGAAGYAVFRNGAKVGEVGKNVTTFTDSGLAPTSTYSYTVKAFTRKAKKTTKYWNSKKQKWQKKKPKKSQWKGKIKKTEKTYKYTYSKKSNTAAATTAAPIDYPSVEAVRAWAINNINQCTKERVKNKHRPHVDAKLNDQLNAIAQLYADQMYAQRSTGSNTDGLPCKVGVNGIYYPNTMLGSANVWEAVACTKASGVLVGNTADLISLCFYSHETMQWELLYNPDWICTDIGIGYNHGYCSIVFGSYNAYDSRFDEAWEEYNNSLQTQGLEAKSEGALDAAAEDAAAEEMQAIEPGSDANPTEAKAVQEGADGSLGS